MAIVAVVVAGVFVAHAASASSTVATDNLSGTAGSGNSTAGHTCPNMTNTTASPTATVSQGLWP